MIKDAGKLLFGLLALAMLVLGCFGAQALWRATRHRYDDPNSGYYHGSVHARFDNPDNDVYSFSFDGRSQPRWQWTYRTNFIYRSLRFEWHRFDEPPVSTDSGTLRLPSLAYESSRGTGILTRRLLSEWLLGTTNGTPAEARDVDQILGFIEAAAKGILPAPRHHAYHYERPVRGRIHHFQFGPGVSGLVYVWAGVWLSSVVFFGRRYWRRRGGASK